MARKKNSTIKKPSNIKTEREILIPASFQDNKPTIINWIVKLVLAIIILYASYHISMYASKIIKNKIKHSVTEHNKLIIAQLTNVIFYLFFLIGLVLALTTLGIQPTALLTVLGTFMVTIGLAMQGVLSNIFAGVSVVLSDSFRIGDVIRLYIPFINSEIEGRVENLNVNYVILKETHSKRILYIPNSIVAANMIVNLSLKAIKVD